MKLSILIILLALPIPCLSQDFNLTSPKTIDYYKSKLNYGVPVHKIPKSINKIAFEHAPILHSRQDTIDYLGGFSSGLKYYLIHKKDPNIVFSCKLSEKGHSIGIKVGKSEEHGISLKDYGFIEVIVEGFLYFNIGQADFRILNSFEIAWIEKSDFSTEVRSKIKKLKEHWNEVNPSKDERYNIVLKVSGLINNYGYYGNLNRYERELLIIDVIEVRKADEKEVFQRKVKESEFKIRYKNIYIKNRFSFSAPHNFFNSTFHDLMFIPY